MEQRDYLQREIEQLGRVLGKLLSDLLGLKSDGKVSDSIETTDQVLKDELNLTIEDLTAIPTDKFISMLQSDQNFSNRNLEQLAGILLLLAGNRSDGDDVRKMLYEKCLTIYEHLEKTESTYSLDRNLKMEIIKNELQ